MQPNKPVSDEELLCGFMEKSPDKGPFGFRPWRAASPLGWWDAVETPQQRPPADGSDGEWVPRHLGLYECHRIEARLSEEQRGRYLALLDTREGQPFDLYMLWSMVHADAPTKIAALAAVIRGGK